MPKSILIRIRWRRIIWNYHHRWSLPWKNCGNLIHEKNNFVEILKNLT